MGSFSWECKCCGESMKEGDWMGDVVIVGSDESLVRGEYDGYGRVLSRSLGEVDLMGEGDFACYHAACYALAGKPAYDGSSNPADDQGLGESEIEPQSLADVEAIKARRKERNAEAKARWEAFKIEKRAELEAKGEEIPAYLR